MQGGKISFNDTEQEITIPYTNKVIIYVDTACQISINNNQNYAPLPGEFTLPISEGVNKVYVKSASIGVTGNIYHYEF